MASKNIKIQISLEGVLPCAEERLADVLNAALSVLYGQCMAGNGGLQPFREKWTIDMVMKENTTFEYDPDTVQGTIFDGEPDDPVGLTESGVEGKEDADDRG